MAWGPRSTADNVILTGWDASELEKFRLSDNTSYSDVIGMASVALGALANELTGNPLWAGLISFTDEPTTEYRSGASNSMTLATEYGSPDAQRAETVGHMLPLQRWDYALAWTKWFLEDARMTQIEADLAAAVQAVRNRWRIQLLTRLLKRTDDSGAAKGLGSSGYSPGFATAAGSTNVDFAPPAYAGTEFTTSHEHYVGITGGVFTADVFSDAKDELKEHGHTPPFEFWVGPTARSTVTGLTGFVGVRSGLIAYGSTADLAADTSIMPTDGVELLGVMSDEFRVWEVRGMPQYYGVAYKSYGPRSAKNPLKVRVPKGQSTLQIFMESDDRTGRPNNPLQNMLVKTRFGVGVYDRTAATPRYVNSATWADGTPT